MKNTVISEQGLPPDDHIFHPCPGVGRELCQEIDNSVGLHFAENTKADIRFSVQVVSLNYDGISRFILSARCAGCKAEVDIDLTLLGDTGKAGFREVSLLCRTAEVQVGYTPAGTPMYIHRSCGEKLIPGNARPVWEDMR